jgi:hypothetical protein
VEAVAVAPATWHSTRCSIRSPLFAMTSLYPVSRHHHHRHQRHHQHRRVRSPSLPGSLHLCRRVLRLIAERMRVRVRIYGCGVQIIAALQTPHSQRRAAGPPASPQPFRPEADRPLLSGTRPMAMAMAMAMVMPMVMTMMIAVPFLRLR